MNQQVPGAVQPIKTAIRKDVVNALGSQFEAIIQAAHAHMMDAVSTVLVLFERFHCLNCIGPRLIGDFFPWINEEGYTYIVEEFDYALFMRECVKWADGWTREQVESPCTDGMPSSKVH